MSEKHKPLTDGLWKCNKQRHGHLFIKDKKLWIELGAVCSPLLWVMTGRPVMKVGKKIFIKGADVIEELPNKANLLREIAKVWGVEI